MKPSFNKIDLIKYFSALYFVIPGAISLIHTIIVFPEYYLRDLIILIVLSLPLIINRRVFYSFYGLSASCISLMLLATFLIFNSPNRIDISIFMYVTGAILFFLGVVSGIAMIYIGTFSTEKYTFRLV